MYIDVNKENNKEGPKLKLVIMLDYQNIKIFLPKAIFQIGLKKVLPLKNLKILCCEYMLLVILTDKKLLELS